MSICFLLKVKILFILSQECRVIQSDLLKCFKAGSELLNFIQTFTGYEETSV